MEHWHCERREVEGQRQHRFEDRDISLNRGTSPSRNETQTPIPLCDYCGDDFLNETSVVANKKETYHASCFNGQLKRNKDAIETFKKYASASDHILSMSIHVSYLFGQPGKDEKKKRKREQKLRELCNKVSALRNSGSGHLVIHLVGWSKDDNFIGYFDEFADVKLKNLIRDGSLFSDVYEKQRMSDWVNVQELKEFTDFLVLYVDGAAYLTTSELNTKISLDDAIIDPTDANVETFLRRRRKFNEDFPPAKSPADLRTLQESRSVQVKASFLSKGETEDIVTSLLQKHRITEYVSAFTKLTTGGSFFYGVKENNTTYDIEERMRTQRSYKSRELVAQCVPVRDCERVDRDLKVRIRQSVLVCDYDGNEITDVDLVKICFIPSFREDRRGEERGHFVIQIAVKPVSGIVFYNSEGPVAYRVEEDSIQKYTVKEWFHLFLK